MPVLQPSPGQESLTEAPVLAYPNPQQPFIVDTDASNVGNRAGLSQQGGDGEHAVAYFSRALSRAEKNYCVTRHEVLAVVVAPPRKDQLGTPIPHCSSTWWGPRWSE